MSLEGILIAASSRGGVHNQELFKNQLGRMSVQDIAVTRSLSLSA